MQDHSDSVRVVLEARYYPSAKHQHTEHIKPLARITRSLTVDAIPRATSAVKNSSAFFKRPSQLSSSQNLEQTEPADIKAQPNRSLLYHMHTVWLFTLNDLQSIVLPHTFCGLASALSGPALTTNFSPSFFTILTRIPLLVVWTYLNVLVFDVSNQRLSPSIVEDSYNKSWRPLPSHRLTPAEARRFLLTLLPLISVTTYIIGGLRETVAMIVLTWMYNDLGGADEHYAVRNAINALGFICYAAGTTVVAAGPSQYGLNEHAWVWLGMVGAVIFTTLQMQDLPDVEGDAKRGRKTLPLVAGQEVGRWSVAAPVAAWSIICPTYWRLGPGGFMLPGMLGVTLTWRVLNYRTIKDDKLSWKLWCAWSVSLYVLPLFADYGVFQQAAGSLMEWR